MNFNTKEEKLDFFRNYLESKDLLVERMDEIEQTPGFAEVGCLITASRIETYEGDDSLSEEKAGEILVEEGNVALINAIKSKKVNIKPAFVSEIMVYSMKDDDGDFFVFKTVAQLSSSPEYEQIIHKISTDMDTPKEEFIAFINDSFEQIDELKTKMAAS